MNHRSPRSVVRYQFSWDGRWDTRESFLSVVAVSSFAFNLTEHDTTDQEAKHLDHPALRHDRLETDQYVYLESFDDEGGSTRAAQKALDRELLWHTIGDADRPASSEAIAKEWRGWLRWGAIRPATASELKSIAKNHILPSRVAYRWKPIPLGRKAKARIVVQGFCDPHLSPLARDFPVLTRAGLLCLLQVCANIFSHKDGPWTLQSADCPSAFLQGGAAPDRPSQIFMRTPSDPIALVEIDRTARRCAKICGRNSSQLSLQAATRAEVARPFLLEDDDDYDVLRFAMALHGCTYMGLTILEERAAPVEAEAPPTAEGEEAALPVVEGVEAPPDYGGEAVPEAPLGDRPRSPSVEVAGLATKQELARAMSMAKLGQELAKLDVAASAASSKAKAKSKGRFVKPTAKGAAASSGTGGRLGARPPAASSTCLSAGYAGPSGAGGRCGARP